MARLTVPVHPAGLFTWSRVAAESKRIGVCEASTLGPAFRAARIYDDSADLGFELLSPTGKKVLFAWSREVRDSRGEDLIASVWSAVGLPGVPVEVHILNT